MSLESGEQLPLPSEPRCIAVVPGMHTAWTALVLLSGEVCSGKSELQRNAGPMLLAFRYLQKAMVEAMKDTSGENKTELANTAKDVVRAGQWVCQLIHDSNLFPQSTSSLHIMSLYEDR